MQIQEIQKKLENYDNEISNAEKKKSMLEGKQEMLLQKLKSEFNITDFNDIDKYILSNQQRLSELENMINENLAQLEKMGL